MMQNTIKTFTTRNQRLRATELSRLRRLLTQTQVNILTYSNDRSLPIHNNLPFWRLRRAFYFHLIRKRTIRQRIITNITSTLLTIGPLIRTTPIPTRHIRPVLGTLHGRHYNRRHMLSRLQIVRERNRYIFYNRPRLTIDPSHSLPLRQQLPNNVNTIVNVLWNPNITRTRVRTRITMRRTTIRIPRHPPINLTRKRGRKHHLNPHLQRQITILILR